MIQYISYIIFIINLEFLKIDKSTNYPTSHANIHEQEEAAAKILAETVSLRQSC